MPAFGPVYHKSLLCSQNTRFWHAQVLNGLSLVAVDRTATKRAQRLRWLSLLNGNKSRELAIATHEWGEGGEVVTVARCLRVNLEHGLRECTPDFGISLAELAFAVGRGDAQKLLAAADVRFDAGDQVSFMPARATRARGAFYWLTDCCQNTTSCPWFATIETPPSCETTIARPSG